MFMWRPIRLDKVNVGTIFIARRRRIAVYQPEGSDFRYSVPWSLLTDFVRCENVDQAYRMLGIDSEHPWKGALV